jgi:hypothetical protein
MATIYKVLGQNEPAATTNTTLYTVPAASSAVCSTLVICNKGMTTTVRVAIRPSGATLEDKHYIVYDQIVNATDSFFLSLGLTLATTDVVTVYAGTADVSFGLFGTEIS